MTTVTYTRPTKTKATAVGQRGRTYWSRRLRKQAYDLLPVLDFMAAEATLLNTVRKRPGQDRAAWTSIRTRIEHAALLDVLRQRHLENTGQEISRSEALAALMVAGLETIVNRNEFKRPTSRNR
ncbi:hypothetical protein K3X13_10005 [Aliiroseovarius crassostreae]|uniref:hypothetical protein n=1 Tax=Aliiroseovarius crassostreae TaxID=154981 RepID=UPI0022029A62|nr:hypothetical protein [Aliiroseovarius crassostreae]UWP91403.1 hypothetical protein K3X13_10005 [Aliiroseovarius crassostreae]